ncbi:hypothetical protein GF354_05080 [Candidatus Peregrinibacteria bacterium]|nr:hypothetical protein [Candidatus Peregrinibacteria bacterium]
MFKEKFLLNQRGKEKAFNLLAKALQSAKQKLPGGPETQAQPEIPAAPETVEAPHYRAVLNNALFGSNDLPPNLNDWSQWQGEGVIGKWTKYLNSNEQTEEFKAELRERIKNLQNSYTEIESFTDSELSNFIAQLEAASGSSEV